MDASLTDPTSIESGLSDAQLAAELVRRAGLLAASMRAGGLDHTTKTNVSDVVTAADHAAEELVVAALRAHRPDDGIIGEEGADQRSVSGRTWVIDPVDGTYNFLSGLTYWCSALALRDHDGPLVGAVHHVAPGELWLGERGARTTCNGLPVPIIDDVPLERGCLASYLHPTRLLEEDLLDPFVAMASGAATVRMLGSSSCDLAGVAAGRIEAWAQQSVNDWDWLPGEALVLGAGGTTRTIEHRGHRWSLAGTPSAVAGLAARLTSS